MQDLGSGWIDQSPRVESFEREFEKRFGGGVSNAISCGSGTDPLHPAYLLAGVKPGYEVISAVFTCTASNLPSLYIGATPIFADIQVGNLNIDPKQVKELITERTKAIVFLDYGGVTPELDELVKIASGFNIPLIEDAARALGARYPGLRAGSISYFTVFSFQAIKHITTGDGGMLMMKERPKVAEAKSLRWFGINCKSQFEGISENGITEIGLRYQMNYIAVANGLAALEEFYEVLELRRTLLKSYVNGLKDIPGLQVVGSDNVENSATWLVTILVPNAKNLKDFIFTKRKESGQVNFRNDRYSIFGGRRSSLPNMDFVESKYTDLPLHTQIITADVEVICSNVHEFYL